MRTVSNFQVKLLTLCQCQLWISERKLFLCQVVLLQSSDVCWICRDHEWRVDADLCSLFMSLWAGRASWAAAGISDEGFICHCRQRNCNTSLCTHIIWQNIYLCFYPRHGWEARYTGSSQSHHTRWKQRTRRRKYEFFYCVGVNKHFKVRKQKHSGWKVTLGRVFVFLCVQATSECKKCNIQWSQSCHHGNKTKSDYNVKAVCCTVTVNHQ